MYRVSVNTADLSHEGGRYFHSVRCDATSVYNLSPRGRSRALILLQKWKIFTPHVGTSAYRRSLTMCTPLTGLVGEFPMQTFPTSVRRPTTFTT